MSYLQDAINVLVYLSIPQTILYTWFAFLFLGITAERLAGRTVLFGLLVSLYVSAGFFALSFPAHAVNSIAAVLVGLRLTFHELSVRRIAAIFAVSFGTAFLSDLCVVALVRRYLYPDYTSNITFVDTLLAAWPFLGLVALLDWSMHHRRIYPAKRLASLFAASRLTPVPYFILLIGSQLLVLLLFIVVQFSDHPDRTFTVLFIAVCAAVLMMSFLLLRIIARTREEAVRRTQTAYVSDLQRIITSIRFQRHTFITKVQSMYAMLKSGRLEELRSAMEQTADGIKTERPAAAGDGDGSPIKAFVEAKKTEALSRKIRFEARAHGLDDAIGAFRSTDLIRIIGNLTNNAFDEACELPAIERYVCLEIVRDGPAIVITVTNSGRGLSEDKRASLFEPGFSTKADGHSGIGLPIVAELVRGYGGTIEAGAAGGGEVRFKVRLPIMPPYRQGESPSCRS